MSKIISKYFFNEESAAPLGAAKRYLWQQESASKEGKHGEKTPSTLDDAP